MNTIRYPFGEIDIQSPLVSDWELLRVSLFPWLEMATGKTLTLIAYHAIMIFEYVFTYF
jgi:hypothetical protein